MAQRHVAEIQQEFVQYRVCPYCYIHNEVNRHDYRGPYKCKQCTKERETKRMRASYIEGETQRKAGLYFVPKKQETVKQTESIFTS